MLVIYPAIIHVDDDGLWAEFPDLPGCFTQGDTQEELLANAAEAMECFLLGLLEDGEKLPQASAPQAIKLTEPNTYTSLIQTKIDLAKNTKSVKKRLLFRRGSINARWMPTLTLAVCCRTLWLRNSKLYNT